MGLKLAMRVYKSSLKCGLKPTAAFVATLADDDSGLVELSSELVQRGLGKCRTSASTELQDLRDLRILKHDASVKGGRGRKEILHRFDPEALPRPDANRLAERTVDDVNRSAERTVDDVNRSAERTVDDVNRSAERTVDDVNRSAERTVDNVNRSAKRTVSTWNRVSVRTSVSEENTRTEERTSTRTGVDGAVKTPQLEHLRHVSKLVHVALDAQTDLSDLELSQVVKARCVELKFDPAITDQAIKRARQVRANIEGHRKVKSDREAGSRVPSAAETDRYIDDELLCRRAV